MALVRWNGNDLPSIQHHPSYRRGDFSLARLRGGAIKVGLLPAAQLQFTV
jgi:hypothetical protein